MIRFALKGLAGRKFRAILTALAIVLGVAMVSGTYVLTDTISKAFDNLFTDSYAGTSVVIRGQDPDISFQGTETGTPPVDAALLETVRGVPEVDAAVGGIEDVAKLLDKQGKALETQGAPTFGFGIDPSQPRFNPLKLTDGRWPVGNEEVAIDAGTADKEDYAVGDSIGISALGPIEQFEVVGVARFGTVDSIGSATFAIFDLPTAQRLFDKEGKLDGISIAAKPGVEPAELAETLNRILPDDAVAKTAAEQADEDSQETSQALSFIQYFLLAFGGIALFVGAFVIFNTLSITVAQRSREFATLRTLGASRRQVLGSVV
ncbi:MAG: ABC transporter permease, partial [Gaiellaceae bacterium]